MSFMAWLSIEKDKNKRILFKLHTKNVYLNLFDKFIKFEM